ncbi:MAG: hypothetical protein R3B09_08530 [Nannocystaceae bacterium]
MARRWTPPRLALVAFCGHAPGIWILTGARLTPALARVNLVALGLTLAAMAAAGLVSAPDGRLFAVLYAWLIGHFVWSTIFAAWILRGGALRLSD